MPGTIQVSVLDLLGLPSSSMSVKVSMGKREHQIWDRGEFSFPLMTLRENLIVTLYDSEGNELSQTGVNTMLVVEKGCWDDLFPLQGGGHLHMKLEFILSEQERKRIREMRETALRKKQHELLSNSKRSSETAAVDIFGPSTETAFNHEVTDSQERSVQREAVSIASRNHHGHPLSSLAYQKNYLESGPLNREAVRYKHTRLNEIDGRQKTPAESKPSLENEILRPTDKPSQLHEVLHLTDTTQQTMKNPDAQFVSYSVPARPISSEGAFEHSKASLNNVTIGSEGAISAPIPSEEHVQNGAGREGTSSETTPQILVKIKTPSPPNGIATRHNSLQKQTHSTIEQISLRKLPKDNVTGGEGASREAAPAKTDYQVPAYNITTMPNSSDNSDNQSHSTMKQTLLESTSRNNETNREGTSSVVKLPQALEVFNHTKTTQKVMEKSGTQSPPPVVPIRSISSKDALGSSNVLLDEKLVSASSPVPENQMHSTVNQTAFGKTPSMVRKMISALESSSSQGAPTPANAPKLKPHLRKVKSEVALKEHSMHEAKVENIETEKQTVDREFNSYSITKPLIVDVLQNVPLLNRVKTRVSLKGPNINESTIEKTEVKKQIVERKLNLFPGREPLEVTAEQNMKNVKSQKQVHFDDRTVGASDKLQGSLSSRKLDVRSTAVEENNISGQLDCTMQNRRANLDGQEPLFGEFSVIDKAEIATISGRILDDPLERGQTLTVQQTIKAAERLPISQNSGRLELLDARPVAVEGVNSLKQFDCEKQHKKDNLNREETLLEQFVVASGADMTIISEDTHTSLCEQQGSALNALKKSVWRNSREMSEKTNTCGTFLGKRKSLEYLAVDQSLEVMGSWTLPDERRRMCITTGSKQMMEIMGCFDSCGESNQSDTSFPGIEVVKEVPVDSGISVEMNESEMTSHNMRRSKTEKTEDGSVPGRRIGQAVRIGIMVAFGALVLVTRQTRNR